MIRIECSIRGIKPLLQHKLSLDVESKLENKIKKRAGKPAEDNPEDFLYKLNEKIVQPSEHILQAIIKRMGNYKIQGRGKKTYKEMSQGCLMIEPEFIVHKNQKWITDTRSVVIPSTKGRTIRKRPRFDNWELDFTISITSNDLPMEVIKSALDDAGREGGIGDYRPRFGLFIVSKFKELN